jgi:hypothetical protein
MYWRSFEGNGEADEAVALKRGLSEFGNSRDRISQTAGLIRSRRLDEVWAAKGRRSGTVWIGMNDRTSSDYR